MVTLNIAEAAQRLGVSQKTIRRRLGSGDMKGRRVSRPQGYTWAVYLDGEVDGATLTDRLRRRATMAGRMIGRRTVGRPLAYTIAGLSLATMAYRLARSSGRV